MFHVKLWDRQELFNHSIHNWLADRTAIYQKVRKDVYGVKGERVMTEWNDRIKQAQEAVFNDSLGKEASLTGHGVAAMLARMLHFLKEPEPMGKKSAHAYVRDPDGHKWVRRGEEWIVIDSEAFFEACDRYATPAEAFRVGAIVRWTFDNVERKGHVEATIVKIESDVSLAHIALPDDTTGIYFEALELVKPAPEAKS